MGAGARQSFPCWNVARLLIVAIAVCAAVAGCAMWRPGAASIALPEKYTVTLDQLVIHTNFPLPSQHRLLQEINAERRGREQQAEFAGVGRDDQCLSIQRCRAVLRVHSTEVSELSRPPGVFC